MVRRPQTEASTATDPRLEYVRSEFQALVGDMEVGLQGWEKRLNGSASDEELDRALPAVTRDIYSVHNRMQKCVAGLDKTQLAQLKKFYRARLNRFFRQGEIIRRCIERPRGYHGDFGTMMLMYENDYRGDSNLGKVLHKFITADASSTSVRKRREYLVRRMRTLFAGRAGSILSVACGPATEIVDCLKEGVRFKRIALLDQDHEALRQAEEGINRHKPADTELVVLNISIIDFILGGDEDLSGHGPYDFVYSAGLYDYLPDEYARKLTADLMGEMSEVGVLDIGNFTKFPIGFFAEFTSGWRLILRDIDDIRRFLPDGAQHEFQRVGDQTFVTLYPS